MRRDTIKGKKSSERGRILFVTILLIGALISIYYFHSVLHISTIFTHFFYIPIIFACIWWEWRGMLVALFLSLNLLICHFFFVCPSSTHFDLLRPAMFIFVAYLVVRLRKEALSATEETKLAYKQFNQIFRAAGNGLRVIDKDFNMIRFNESFLNLSGLSKDEVCGKKCFEAFPSPECHTSDCILKRILNGEERVESDTERKRGNGTRIFCTLTATPLRGERGEIVGIVEDIKDITDHKLGEEALRKSEERYRSFVKGIEGIAYECDMDYSPIFFHGAIEKITGYTEDDLNAGKPRWIQIVHKDDLSQVYKNTRLMCKVPCFYCTSYEQEYRIIRKDGKIRWVREDNQHVCDESGTPIGIRGVLYDITERKEIEEALHKSEEQFLHAQKMEAIGRLAGGIAHDFNNILTIIMGNIDLVLDKVNDISLRYDLDEIRKAGERAASLISKILSFSRKQVIQSKVLDVASMITDAEKLIRRIIGEDIKLTTISNPDLSYVRADPGQLDQVIMNLVVNARDAMPHGGVLTIKADNVIMDKDHCKAFPNARPGRFVRISVEDTGIGMDKATLDQIFEPFFTTKMPGKGTGLGLSTVYGIITQHEGWIHVDSRPGHGTRFEIYLPAISRRQTDKPKEKDSLLKFQGSGERILIVEDDKGVRQFAKKALEENGYIVFEAANALDALSLFEKEKGDFFLVLSDIVLPDINGIQFAEQLLSKSPGLSIILCSGYSSLKSLWTVIGEMHLGFIRKPFNAYDLLLAIKGIKDIKGIHATRGKS